MKFKSVAVWPDGEITEDIHDTISLAESVCRILKEDGFGGNGKIFLGKVSVVESE